MLQIKLIEHIPNEISNVPVTEYAKSIYDIFLCPEIITAKATKKNSVSSKYTNRVSINSDKANGKIKHGTEREYRFRRFLACKYSPTINDDANPISIEKRGSQISPIIKTAINNAMPNTAVSIRGLRDFNVINSLYTPPKRLFR